MQLIPGYRYGIRFTQMQPAILENLGTQVVSDTSPDLAYFVNRIDAEDFLLRLAADKRIRILEQNISRKYPQSFGSDNPIGGSKWKR